MPHSIKSINNKTVFPAIGNKINDMSIRITDNIFGIGEGIFIMQILPVLVFGLTTGARRFGRLCKIRFGMHLGDQRAKSRQSYPFRLKCTIIDHQSAIHKQSGYPAADDPEILEGIPINDGNIGGLPDLQGTKSIRQAH
jgi:hypothetical protein